MTALTDFMPRDTSISEDGPTHGTAARHRQRAQVLVRLSVAEAAQRAHVSPRTVKRWIIAGLLPATTRLPSPKGRGHLRIGLGDLEALLARGTLK